MGHGANLLILAVTALAIKLAWMGSETAPLWIKRGVLVFLVLGALGLVWRGLFLARCLVIPRWIALCILPLALGFLTQEALIQQKRVQGRGPVALSRSAPDIILVTLDALSSRHLSCYGYSRPTSPHLDAFAQDAILFEGFYANANWTRPGFASLLNGARPWTHAGDLGRPLRSVRENQNLLGCLARAGYEIRTVSSNAFADHAWQGTPTRCTERVLVQGGLFHTTVGLDLLPSSVFANGVGPALYLQQGVPSLFQSPSRDRTRLPLAWAEEMLGRAPTGRPRFFWLHLVPPHDPYATPDPFLGRFEPSSLVRGVRESAADYRFAAGGNPERQKLLEGRYDEAVSYVDAAVGQLLDWLKAHGRFEGSLVVVSADHGESFSHGYGGHGGPLLTEDLVRVPCLIKPPGHTGAKRVSRLFEQADLAPTLLHMAGLPIPLGMEGQPYPLKAEGLPTFSMNRDLSTRKPTFSLAMRQGNWKYVVHFGPWAQPWPRRELYDLDRDPNENQNMIEGRPEIVGPMHRRILEELTKRGLKPEAP